jgi:anthranilate synthase component 1
MSVVADLELTPGLDEVRELARTHNLVPLRHTFIADCETPVSAYLKLRGGGPSFLLESAEQGQRIGRWSFLGFHPRATIRMSLGDHPDPYAVVAEELGRYRIAPLEGLPPFAGGAVGLFGYDLVRSAEPSVGGPNPDPVGIPDLALMISDVLVAFDHLRHEVTVLANVLAGDDLERAYGQAAAAIADVKERLAGPVPQIGTGKREPPQFASNLGPDGFAAAVERCKEYIRAGDVYQVVPSQRWTADCPVDAFSIYRGLRAINPSPYMYFLDFEDFEVAGASPESLVTVNGRHVELKPIAGTRPRPNCGTGPARRSLTSAIAAAACPYARSRWSSASTFASTVTSWRRWSNATSTSVIINARSGMPVSSGLGSPTLGSALRTRSYPNMPTAPPANGGSPSSGAIR